MGSVKKDKRNGNWYYVFDIGKDENGKRKQRKRSGFKLKKDAEEALREDLQLYHAGDLIKDNDSTFKELVEYWLNIKTPDVSNQTLKVYHYNLKNHILPAFGSMKLSDITTQKVQAFITRLVNAGLSAATIKKIYHVLNNVMKTAVQDEFIKKNPVEKVRKPSVKRKEVEVWSAEQMSLFLDHTKNSRYYIAFWLAISFGLRQGEILGLRFKDIDFNNGVLRIVQTLEHSGGQTKYGGKSSASTRTIDLSEHDIHVLKKQKSRIQKEKSLCGGFYTDRDLVVCTDTGNAINPRNLLRQFKAYLKQLDLPDIPFHNLRHSHASLLLTKFHPKVVQERLGHKDIQVTLNTYSHLMPNMQKDASTFISGILQGKQKEESH
ncbi:site-specific integrase [Bacillus halotolerans]|uniref:site-specific integrase n=1 Tax=Bacillus halotolerans TaxID=260554 RepID=UPI00292F4A14|nr:site-specific integrase [Bacillus halotolerans]